MCIKTAIEAADAGCCAHIIREAVPVCHNSLREKILPLFHPGKGHKDGVLDLVDATDVFVCINEIIPSLVFQDWKSEISQSV